MSDEEQIPEEAIAQDDEGALSMSTNEETKYGPLDKDEQRRSWILEIMLQPYAHLGPAEFVQALKWVEDWLAKGEVPAHKEIEKEKKLRPVSQLRGV